ncbi:MAG TPA: DUF2207 domain-containing protein, partial [Candidatus Diapherotrites archaeon]|nr:DUF2207 domain-containing protein [Candidatus Diapherotrites archaeon]
MRNSKKALLALAIFLLLASFASAKSFYFPNVSIDYKIAEDASVQAREELTFNFEGSFSFAYREIPLQGIERVENFKVFEKTPKGLQELQPSISYSPFKATWYYQAFNEQKTFVLEYTLKNAVKEYDDSFELYWKLWGDYWDARVDNFNARIEFPKPLAEGSKVWLHPALEGSWNLEGSLLEIQASGIP